MRHFFYCKLIGDGERTTAGEWHEDTSINGQIETSIDVLLPKKGLPRPLQASESRRSIIPILPRSIIFLLVVTLLAPYVMWLLSLV